MVSLQSIQLLASSLPFCLSGFFPIDLLFCFAKLFIELARSVGWFVKDKERSEKFSIQTAILAAVALIDMTAAAGPVISKFFKPVFRLGRCTGEVL